jgi:hypothetical protein
MPDPREQVRHDASSLYRFVDSISAFTGVQIQSPAYLSASKLFLSYVHELGEKTKEYLTTFHTNTPSDAASFNIYRQELAVLRNAWSEIHRRVKPTADADTLHLPASLLWIFVRRLNTIPDFADVDFAVFHTEQLNYLQVVAKGIRDTAAKIATFTGAKPFPKQIGLIGIPYSQSETILLNCLIAHEIGHFVFGEKKLRDSFANDIITSLTTHVAPVASLVSPDQLRWLPSILADHAEELFCDLFAIRFLGPCYSFAFIEILDLPNILDSSKHLNDTSSAPYLEFSESHPAVLFRIQQHTLLLERLSWWDEIAGLSSHYRSVLEEAKAIPRPNFKFSLFGPIGNEVLKAFFALVSIVDRAVDDILRPLDTGLADYKKNKVAIAKFLIHGVVPSSVFDTSEKPAHFSAPIAVINVAHMIYLDRLEELIGRIDNQEVDRVKDRTRWMAKLEMWTSKALEDYQLLSMRNK